MAGNFSPDFLIGDENPYSRYHCCPKPAAYQADQFCLRTTTSFQTFERLTASIYDKQKQETPFKKGKWLKRYQK